MIQFHNIVPLLILISIISTPALTAAFSTQSSSSLSSSSSSSTSPLKLRLNQENTIIQSNRQWTRVKLAFYDLKEPTVRYDEYPQGWNQVLDYLYIPAERRRINRKYPCRITVKSKNGPEYKASVVFLIGNQKLILSDLMFNYDQVFDDDFFNSGIFSGRPILVRDTTTISKLSAQQKIEDPQMQNKKIAVQKINAVSSTPGAGIYNVLNGIEGNKKTVSLTNLINSIKLKQQLKPNVQSQSVPSNNVQNQFASSSVSAFSQKNAPSQGNSQNRNQITSSGVTIKNNVQAFPKNIQEAATINSFIPTFAKKQFTQTLPSPDVGSVLEPQSNLGLNQISPIPNLSVESGSTSNSFSTSGLTSSSSSSASISSSSSSSSSSATGSNSITGTSNSSTLPSSFPPSSPSAISASALLLPTPNNLNPGTPNILDNPNLTASQKQQVLVKTIKQTQIQETSQQKSIESFFFKLPGPQQLDSIILTADSFAILKTIQTVVQSELDCQQRISYLSDFLGRIQAAISLKAFSASQLAVIVESAQQEVSRLQRQIQQNKKFIASIGVQELRAKLNEVQEQLQVAYSNYNNAEIEVTAKNEEIAKLILEIQLTSSSSASNSEITAQKLQLLQLTTSISNLESQYNEAIARRESITSNIQKLTQSISASQTIISTSQTKIIELEKQRRQKQSSSEQIKLKYQALQVSIERQRSQIAIREKKLSEVSLLVKNLEQRLEIAQAKTNNVEISRLTSFVASLQIIVANVTTQIDDVTFRCNYLQQYSNTSSSTNTTIYTIPIKQYTSYLQSCYQPSSSSTKIDFSINSIVNALTSYITSSTNLKNQYQYNQALGQIKVTPLSILDGSWLSAFGNPYSSGSYTQAKEFYFYDDFQCQEKAKLETGSGLIKAVNKKAIDVSSGSKVYRLNLGACSRIQSTNQLPKVGQKIFYRAQRVNNNNNNNQYNLYKASCI